MSDDGNERESERINRRAALWRLLGTAVPFNLGLLAASATDAVAAQLSAPRNLRLGDPNAQPPPPSTVTVRTGHPRLHFTPETLVTWRSWLAGPLEPVYQQYVAKTASLLTQQPLVTTTKDAANTDHYALIWLAGQVAGIDYGSSPPETFAQAAVELIRMRVGLGPIPIDTGFYGKVNHPFHSGGGHWLEILARAHDWLWQYPGYTDADKRATATYLLESSRILFEEPHPNDGQVMMQWSGPGNVFETSPAESHFPWYYVLPLIGDGHVDDVKARTILATFDTHWLNGAWLDAIHYESRGAGTKALGSYGGWYPLRIILNFQAWKTATGQDYFNSPTPLSPEPAYFRNYPVTYGSLQKPQAPKRVLPLGQASGDSSFPDHIMKMLTGVLTGQPARLAAALGGSPTISGPDEGLPLLLTYNPSVVPETMAPGVTHFETYGLLVDRRADQTILTMGAPVIKLQGHTWATQGGGPKNGIPLGVTLQVRGVPVLVKHVGDHRGAMKSFGQNAMRFFDPLIPTTDLSHWTHGGFLATGFQGRRVQDIDETDNKGGIAGWTSGNPNRAVADLARWYDPALVKSYARSYEWGTNQLRVIDDVETARPDVVAYSRWYTGHRPIAGGVVVPEGVSTRATPGEIQLGPVRWQIVQAPASQLHVVGGPGFEWVDDVGNVYTYENDAGVMKVAGPLEVGTYTITLKSSGSGRWVHLFTW